MQSGLHGRHFATADGTGTPAHETIDQTISTAGISRAWRFAPPEAFSARWTGYLFVDEAGAYTFATTSDDGSEVYVDNRLVVDNAGSHGAVTRIGEVELTRGSHAIAIAYVNAGGPYEFSWAWASARRPLHAVPAWILSPHPRGLATLLAVRALEWLWPVSIASTIALIALFLRARGWWPARDETQPNASIGWRFASLSLAAFTLAAVVQTWPLASNPAHLSRNDNADTILNEWTIAWVAHELPRSPAHLFDANMFYPEKTTLAYSEAMLVQGAVAAPALWLGASPVLAYNLVLLLGFTLTGWSMCLVVASWTGDWIAGLAAGTLLAFNAHTLTRLPHLQAQHVEFLPLVLLTFDALLRKPSWKAAILLSIWFALQSFASIYLLVFMTVALAAGLLARPEDWLGGRWTAVVPKLAVAAILAGAVLTPYLLPYGQLRGRGFVRTLDESAFFAASLRDYLTTPSRFHTWVAGGTGLFPGWVALGLSAVTIATGVAFRDARARMCLVFGVVGVLLSFGPAVAPGYAFLFSTVPLFQAIRTTARFGYLGLVAIAVLGGYGVGTMRRALSRRSTWRLAVSGAVLTLVFLEPLAAPISYEPFTSISTLYKLPASHPATVVAELPLAPPESQYRDAIDLLNSTENWRPLVNGYSGFTPPGYVQRYEEMAGFPSASSIAALRRAGVTDLFVHLDQFDEQAVAQIEREAALRHVASDGRVSLYVLTPTVTRP